MSEGYIALWRKLRDNPLWRDGRRFSKAEAWIDLLMDAEWRDKEVLLGASFIRVQRGQVLLSQRKKAAQWSWARNSVHSFISMLAKAEMVSHEVSRGPEGGYTLLTILKYDEYQPGSGNDGDQPLSHPPGHALSHDRATTGPAVEQSEEVKKGRRRKNLAGDSAPAGSAPPTKPRNGKAPDPNVKRVIDAYHEAFTKKHRTPPPINGGKCGKIAQAILRGRPVEEALWVVREYFEHTPEFYRDKGLYGLEHVLAAMPTLLARRAAMDGFNP